MSAVLVNECGISDKFLGAQMMNNICMHSQLKHVSSNIYTYNQVFNFGNSLEGLLSVVYPK